MLIKYHPTKYVLILLPFLFCIHCSVYKSQGRKDFETDTPLRVPISLIFHCRNPQSLNESSLSTSFEQLRMIPTLQLRRMIYDNTVVLLASTTHPNMTCFSEGLDLTGYTQNQDISTYQINTWP